MLRAIERIDGLGIFDQYRKSSEISQFERFNVFYGMNGSGKTTLSRLFLSLNAGQNDTYPTLKFKISSSEGQFENGQSYPTKVRAFNADYVESNIGEIEGQLNPIFIVGEENKSLVHQIEADEVKLATLEGERINKEREKEKLEKDRGKQFTNIAKLIASDTSGQVIRTYRKPEAERAFAKIKEVEILQDRQLELHRTTVRQSSLEKVTVLDMGQFSIDKDGARVELMSLDALSVIAERSRAICLQTSDSLAVKRLQEKPDIAEWVEKGITLHEAHNSETCEYCLQTIPQPRIDAFAKHFNDSDRLLKENIEEIIALTTEMKIHFESFSYPANSQLYEELRDRYKSAVNSFTTSRKAILSYLDEIVSGLRGKLLRRTESFESSLSDFDKPTFEGALNELNNVLIEHNKKTDMFEAHAEKAQKSIESHHLCAIKSDIDKLDSDIQAVNSRLIVIVEGDAHTDEDGIEALKSRISINRQKVSNTVKAAARLTELLQIFLGHNDLKFEPEGDGYRIMRGLIAAKRLSEGEKTAITFIYFIVQLEDQDFNLSDGIIVIDDPISSLDSNSVYQAFSFLKNAVKDAKQIFLFTHNFDFLKLLLNWCKNIPKAEGKKSYFMLLCNVQDDGRRVALIQPLDKELHQNESEYSYLFKQLYNFRSDGTIAGSYHIPNIARKVLEAFLDFYYPGSENLYRKLQHVDFDPNKKTALLKFANDLSHPTGKGFDPALVPETQKNVRYLLEMIDAVSPIHYKSLKQSIEHV